jgi:ketosteroid isomerase-like protein
MTDAPITGREADSDPTTPHGALVAFYRAFNSRDLRLMERNWQQSAESVMNNPIGGIKRGWPEISAVYARIFGARGKVEVEFHDYTLHVADDVFWAIGRERGRYEGDGTALTLAFRTTRLFRRDRDRRWLQVHHHGSIEDPQLLAAYQQAVR